MKIKVQTFIIFYLSISEYLIWSVGTIVYLEGSYATQWG